MQEVDLGGGEREGLDGVQQSAGARDDTEATRPGEPAAEELEDAAPCGGPRCQCSCSIVSSYMSVSSEVEAADPSMDGGGGFGSGHVAVHGNNLSRLTATLVV